MGKLTKYERYSDAEIYRALIERDPRMIEACSQLAELQAMKGYSDKMLLSKFRDRWPSESRDQWDEDDEFRGRLILRAVHHVVTKFVT